MMRVSIETGDSREFVVGLKDQKRWLMNVQIEKRDSCDPVDINACYDAQKLIDLIENIQDSLIESAELSGLDDLAGFAKYHRH
jgi:hypothetical protein